MRHRPALLLLVLLAPLLPTGVPSAAAGDDPAPRLRIGDAVVVGTAPLLWEGELAAGGGGDLTCIVVPCRAPCGPENCETFALRVDVPEGYWEAREGGLEVSVRWSHVGYDPFVFATTFHLDVLDAAGAVVADGVDAVFASTVLIPAPASGDYVVRIRAEGEGTGRYEAVAQVEAAPVPQAARELLPNLVATPPLDLRVASPEHPWLALGLQRAGIAGCSKDEAIHQGARRCLRFGNAIANLGEGPLEARLPTEQAVEAIVGETTLMRGEFFQRVYRTDGAWTDHAVGEADFHPAHGHFHYARFAENRVYRVDEATGERGEEVARSSKIGFCFEDSGLAALGLPGTAPPRYALHTCLNPVASPDNHIYHGISPNWFDLYYWGLPGQYVEISGVPDGTYDLVTIVNPEGTLLESTRDDNVASTRFRLVGNKVTTL